MGSTLHCEWVNNLYCLGGAHSGTSSSKDYKNKGEFSWRFLIGNQNCKGGQIRSCSAVTWIEGAGDLHPLATSPSVGLSCLSVLCPGESLGPIMKDTKSPTSRVASFLINSSSQPDIVASLSTLIDTKMKQK